MSKVFVFCVGGTGIRVMKSITMLMAAGMSTNGYTVVPILVDPHKDLAERKNLQTFMGLYEDVYKSSTSSQSGVLPHLEGFFNSEMLQFHEVDKQQNDMFKEMETEVSFRTYIDMSKLAADDINNMLVETLFSTKNLDNKLSVGFKGNPNVGTVVLGDWMTRSDWFKSFNGFEKDDRIFIISSIFGGTGASGFPLLEQKVRNASGNPTVKNAVMGAVTVLPYYSLTDPAGSHSDIDSANFITKAKAALSYYEDKLESDYIYYIGESRLRNGYENDEKKQQDKSNFIELVAATALFHFLRQSKPEKHQYLRRAIADDKDSLDLQSLGDGYKPVVKSVADFMLLCKLTDTLPKEGYFPLKKNRGFDKNFYESEPYQRLQHLTDLFNNWYSELSKNDRAFAPLNLSWPKNTEGWVKGNSLDAEDDSYYLLEMIKTSNKYNKDQHGNKLRYLLQFAYTAIDHYTKKIFGGNKETWQK